MRYWKDGKLIESIDFGEVQLGSKKEITFSVENDGDGHLYDMSIKIADPNIKILEAPKSLGPHDTGFVRLQWVPDPSLKKPAKAVLGIEAKETWR